MPKKPKLKSKSGSEGIRKGRFADGMDSVFAEFNASIRFDKRLYHEDIAGSIAHARMLAAQGIITSADAELIEKGLVEIGNEISRGELVFREDLEDVHINIETRLRDKIGPAAGKLHTARSRNDQVALDLRLYLVKETGTIQTEIKALLRALVEQAEREIDTIMPGYTHLQRAQPVRLSHHLLAYAQMFRRDWDRFSDSLNRTAVSPLGSAALAGTTFPIDRVLTAKLLDLKTVAENSMDAVSDRDFAAEFVFCCSLVMMHLSRLAEELIIWSGSEFRFCELPDAYCSGSSIMPQKKNPDACELIRGKTGRVYGDLVSLLTILKALPLTYNKDLQEDKEPVFDSADTVKGCLQIMTAVVGGTVFKADRMFSAASDPVLAATDLADKLSREGLPFREAHEKIGALIRESAKTGMKSEIPSPEEMVEARSHKGGTGKKSVLDQIRNLLKFINDPR